MKERYIWLALALFAVAVVLSMSRLESYLASARADDRAYSVGGSHTPLP